MARFERWTVVMYSKSSGCSRVNDVRRQLFTHCTRTLDHIPHTGSAASTCKASSVPGRLHLKTSKAATPRCPGCFSVGLDARHKHETLGAIWIVLDDASKACALLHHCGCGKACRGNCKCARAGIKCTILFNCEGGCINNDGV